MVRVIPIWKKFTFYPFFLASSLSSSIKGLYRSPIPSSTGVYLKSLHDHTSICYLECVNITKVRENRRTVRLYFTTIHQSSDRLFCREESSENFEFPCQAKCDFLGSSGVLTLPGKQNQQMYGSGQDKLQTHSQKSHLSPFQPGILTLERVPAYIL